MLRVIRARDLFRAKPAHAMPQQFPNHNTPAATLLAGVLPVPGERGFSAWTQPPETCSPNAGSAGVAGTLSLRRIAVPGVQQITTLFLAVITAGVGLTAGQCFAGVWDQYGNLVGITADQSGAWAGTGLIAMPLVASGNGPPFLVDTPYIYVGHWWNAVTSGPQLSRGVINMDPNGVTGITADLATSVTANAGLTTTAPAVLGAKTKSTTLANWYAIA